MSKLTERDSDVIRWLLREADGRDAREPRPRLIDRVRLDLVAWTLTAVCLAIVALLALLQVLAYMKRI